MGTPAYTAPEMVTGDPRAVDERTDVYLLGATLYEVLVGRPPHLAQDLRATLGNALASAPALDASRSPDELARICLRAMARSPADRRASAAELREAPADFLAHRGSAALCRAACGRLDELKDLAKAPEGSRQGRSSWAPSWKAPGRGFARPPETRRKRPPAR